MNQPRVENLTGVPITHYSHVCMCKKDNQTSCSHLNRTQKVTKVNMNSRNELFCGNLESDLFWDGFNREVSHNQNLVLKWSTQNVENQEGGYPQLFMSLTNLTIYPNRF